MASKFILSGLALAGSVLAQCSSSDTLTIRTQDDVTALSGCVPYRGNIAVDPSYSGPLQLNGFTGIDGDLTIEDVPGLISISSDRLTAISGKFTLNGLTQLSTLSMDVLERVRTIDWTALPNLQALQFAQGISLVEEITISNTDLRDLKGIELQRVGLMDINNNRQLNIINVNDLSNVTTGLRFNANGRNLNIMFPNLEDAANLTFRDTASITMPSLSVVRGSMGFYENSFNNLTAPNLTAIQRSLAFVGCNSLVDFTLPSLEVIGGAFLVSNNTNLKSIAGVPKLRVVSGAIAFAGSFDAVSFPALETVRGTTNVTTSSTNSSICDEFKNSGSTDVFAVTPRCATGVAEQTTTVTDDGPADGSGDGKNAASSLGANSAAIMTGLLGAIVAALFL